MKPGIRIFLLLFIVGMALGMRLERKHVLKNRLEKRLMALCTRQTSSPEECAKRIKSSLPDCFEASYRWGRSHGQGELDHPEFVSCFNQKNPRPILRVQKLAPMTAE